MQLSPSSPELETLSATLGDEDEVHSTKSSAFAETLDDEITDQPPITAEPLMTAEPAVEDEVGQHDDARCGREQSPGHVFACR